MPYNQTIGKQLLATEESIGMQITKYMVLRQAEVKQKLKK
jgi:hypothetical protein